jgi:OmpA-OmpF porin, OOP family
MNALRYSFLLMFAATALAAPAARADHHDAHDEADQVGKTYHPVEIGVMGGVHFFEKLHNLGRHKQDGSGISPDHGPLFGLRLGLNLGDWVALEAEGGLIPTRTRDDRTGLKIWTYRGQLLFNLMEPGRFRPFVALGYGGYSSRADNTTVVRHDNDGMWHAGLGGKLLFTDQVGIRLDGRIVAPFAAFNGIAKAGDETGYDGPDFEALLSLYVRLGGKPEPREVPLPPALPPAPPPVDQDPDHDGILGAADKCPNEPEDKDGFEDDDGCPDPDNDKDGILDGVDKCPLQPENINGADDEDGCPEEDTDGDGFFGSKDKCPEQPETKNGYKDDDGCPDEVPAAVKKFTGVIEGINFKTASADILKGSYAVLDKAAAVLKEYPDVVLEIGGHTDDKGTDEYNQDLSQRRADSVKNYLVGKGIDASRLKSVGFGEGSPIGDNKTESGRAKNRRTEFKLNSAQK